MLVSMMRHGQVQGEVDDSDTHLSESLLAWPPAVWVFLRFGWGIRHSI